MEVAASRESAPVGPPTGPDTTITNGDQDLLLDDSLMDDGRSSSLSDIDDVLDNEPSDYEESLKPEKLAPENDSEAETERIEDSPNHFRRTNIVVSSYGPSPSKLAQSTTYDDTEDGDNQIEDSPTKPRSKPNGILESAEEILGLEDSTLSEGTGKKRKRPESGADLEGETGDEDEPPQKRRGSVKSELSDPPADDSALSPEPIEEVIKANEEDTPADDLPEFDLPTAPAKNRKGKKGKRKGRKIRDTADDDMDSGALETGAEGPADDGDDENIERGEDADDGEAAARLEEESAKRMSAMESLTILEKEFAALRDKIYDERISKLNRELEMLTGPNPTHPEYLRQLECVKRHRDAKIKYEHTLFQYRIQALMNKSLAERAQTHSTYFQRIRDIREKHSSAVSKQFYAIQHDRFKTEELSAQHYIPFPTRRSQQIAHQTAYNQEVSIMAGVAKYVGFPAAPSLAPARPFELEEDMEKMGISIETRAPTSHPSANLPRGAMPAMSSNAFRTAAEEAFLEQTPWANPQHPIHHHHHHHHQQQHQIPPGQSRVFESPHASSFTTPAAQKRVVDINAPNGSASTIAENLSAANSSANNTPYGAEQEHQHHGLAHFGVPDYDTDRKSGYRSLSSSPLDVRKPHPSYATLDHRASQTTSSRNPAFSPQPARLGLFQSNASKHDSSPPLSSKQVNPIHPSSGILTGSGSSQMTAR
ncbi:transcriptional regulatory protein DEP1 [Aspergillus udagawae]|uniref:Transcriptional regulatory protein DEP1 n=1 Tax=Aspergillus udagawae TaxID=91492 RepID=A0ABQ1A4A3_9EURO|nr:transcriptional regulatory protein DEP1 [Aspergillus udagawae]GFG07090.1 transcriptional regulatory protein DEP1 [Aspergillus udagawae]GFG21369.1 transcriptional regulatory protein DEP1 [Aspergillus udagawae]